MSKRLFVTASVLTLTLLAAGCGTAIKTGAKAVLGPQGSYLVIDKSANLLDTYSVLEIERPTTDIGAGCPAAFLSLFAREVTEEALKTPHFARIDGNTNPRSPKKPDKTLILRAEIIDYAYALDSEAHNIL